MSDALNLEGVSPEIAAVLQSDTVKALIASAIEQAKAPLVAKRDELLGTLTETRGRMKQYDDLGGLQALTELQASQAAAGAARQAALAQSGDVEAIKTHYSNQLSSNQALVLVRSTLTSTQHQVAYHLAQHSRVAQTVS